MDINEQLNKQLMIKQGAENLARAALNSAKIRDIAQIELQFVNSALQLLKDELQEINGAIHQFQNTTSSSKAIPMIPLGLKETKSVEFTAAFKDFILEHYSEAGKNYNREIQDLNTLREAILSPMRNEDGVDLQGGFAKMSDLEGKNKFSGTKTQFSGQKARFFGQKASF